MKRKQRKPPPACRTCRWRNEKRRSGHPYLYDRVIHVCHQPSQRTILGVDWLPPDGEKVNKERLADLGHCDHYQSAAKLRPYAPVPAPPGLDGAAG
jgi:hypothetical protein